MMISLSAKPEGRRGAGSESVGVTVTVTVAESVTSLSPIGSLRVTSQADSATVTGQTCDVGHLNDFK